MVVLFQGTCFRFHISCLGCRCVFLMIFFLLCHISHVLCSMSREVKASKAMTESINPPIHSPWMPTGRDHGDHDSSKSGCLERFYKFSSMFNLRRSTSIISGFVPIYSVCHASFMVLRLSLPRLVRWGVHRVRLLQVEEALAHRRAMAGRKMGTKRKRGPNVPRYFELGGGQ